MITGTYPSLFSGTIIHCSLCDLRAISLWKVADCNDELHPFCLDCQMSNVYKSKSNHSNSDHEIASRAGILTNRSSDILSNKRKSTREICTDSSISPDDNNNISSIENSQEFCIYKSISSDGSKKKKMNNQQLSKLGRGNMRYKYKGIYWSSKSGKYTSWCLSEGKRIYVGTYLYAALAAKAQDLKSITLNGKDASVNFKTEEEFELALKEEKAFLSESFKGEITK